MKIGIPKPCEESWSAMEPRADGRFCQRCQHTVLDLSRMTRRQAEARIATETGDYLCVRLAIDEGDAPLFRPEPSRARGFVGGLVLVAALSAAGCREGDPEAAELIATEPCTVGGPPMMPIDPAALTDAAPVEPASSEPTEVEPTEEQLELTRRKQELREQAVRPIIRHVAGRMPISRY
jgi:hypothetical protein